MILNKYKLSKDPGVFKGVPVLVINPNQLDELYQLSVVTKHAQRLLQSRIVSPFTLLLQAKVLIYKHKSLIVDQYVYVRLPQNKSEYEYQKDLTEPEIWEIEKDDIEKIVVLNEGKVGIKGGSDEEKETFKILWKETDKDLSLVSRLFGIARESILGLVYKKRPQFGVTYPFPLFRAPFLNVFPGTIKEVLVIVLERLRLRYVAKRDINEVPSGILLTPNLDHLRFLFDSENTEFQEVYRDSFMHTADGYPPMIMYGKASLGYQPQEQVTGVDLFMQLINTIGNEALPYTMYLVGGFGNIPYKTRDYFVSIHPHLKENFVGISTPPFGFLENEEIMDAIIKDINEKKPDIIFAGMTVPTQEKFVHILKKRGVNFGIGFCIGRAIEMVAGYQKKEPALVEKLHLSWVYRALITGSKKEIKKRQQDRVKKDFRFVLRTLFSK